MEDLQRLTAELDQQFQIELYGKDSAMSRFIPAVYETISFDWSKAFEPKFWELFNGLMIKGESIVTTVFLAVFPTDQVLTSFIQQARPGDLLFMHHPLLMECGDPRGKWGRGFVPINPDLLKRIKDKGLSIYTCHAPLDYNKQVGTTSAMCESLKARRIDDFYSGNLGSVGAICEMNETNTEQLIKAVEEIFDIPYVDFEGQRLKSIKRVAVVAGCGDVVSAMQEAEQKGAQAYITGEIHCHVDNQYGREKYARMMAYVANTTMSLIGVSHSASEYLVKKTQMAEWFRHRCDVAVEFIPQHQWWL